ncbi:hypothetical protein KPL39_04210 [Clostridium gasigenes]|uniref:hypothetical protein n=1 Tax=Clostridium gasigenes TaxID=94869 RepID=UPI001C0D159F|nr:hypothetical protein [Clostridium gasigenes]MBU3135468.1 hypothetical protein [Clostridium gasigenes]
MYLSIRVISDQLKEQKEADNLIKTQLDNDSCRYREEQRLNIRPYISEYSGEGSNAIDCLVITFEEADLESTYQDDMKIKIRNIGVGPLISFSVTRIGGYIVNRELERPFHTSVKSLGIGDVMNLNISCMTKMEYMVNTWDIEVRYYDILDNKYRQLITVKALRDERNKLEKCIVESISKQELLQ